jgi:Cys-tRNA(Pro) deacylase
MALEPSPPDPTVERVIAAGADRGIEVRAYRFPDGTRTAADAAAAVGVAVSRIVKSLVFAVDGEPVVALLGGADRLDEARLAAAAGGSAAERVDADRARAATGFSIGGVPPIGHATGLPVFLDDALLELDEVWAAAGTGRDVFPVAPSDLLRATGAAVVHLRAD